MSRILHLALCAAGDSPAIGLCAVPLRPAEDGRPPEWVQLFPVSEGTVKPNDGREPWKIADANALLAASAGEPAIDYDHRTQLANDSKAAAHMQQFRVGGPNGEGGIWAKVDWTKNGGAAVAGREYRFLSPAFLYDKARVITKIIGAALTNNPALDELPALASRQENNLDLTKIAAALGLPETATVEDIIGAINAAKTNSAALCASMGAVATAAGLSVTGDKVGESELTAICAKLKAPAADHQQTVATLSAELTELRTRLLALTAKDIAKTAETKVADAIAAGKLAPAQKDDALALCKSDPEAFDKFIGGAPVVLAGGRQSRSDVPEGELSEEQKAMCSKMDVTEEAFKEQLKAGKEQGYLK